MEAIPVKCLLFAMQSESFAGLENIPRTELIYDLEHILSVSRKMQQAVRLYLSEGLVRDDVGGYDGIRCKRCGHPVNGLLHEQLGPVHYGCVRKSLPYLRSRNAYSIALYGLPRRPVVSYDIEPAASVVGWRSPGQIPPSGSSSVDRADLTQMDRLDLEDLLDMDEAGISVQLPQGWTSVEIRDWLVRTHGA